MENTDVVLNIYFTQRDEGKRRNKVYNIKALNKEPLYKSATPMKLN
jgi:hypothetical protein